MTKENDVIEFLDLDGELDGDGQEITLDEANNILADIDRGLKGADRIKSDKKKDTKKEVKKDGDDYDDLPDDEDDLEEEDAADTDEEPEEESDDEDDDDDESDELTETEEESELEEKELKSYSPEVRKRIKRELAINKEIRTANKRLKQENEELMRVNREKEESASQMAVLAYRALADRTEKDFSEAKLKLKQAKEEGDTDTEVEAQLELNKLYAVRQNIQAQKEVFESAAAKLAERQGDPVRDKDDTTKKATVNNQNEPTEEGNKWIQKNSEWLFSNSPLFLKAKEEAHRLDSSGEISRKFNPNTPEYFDELNRRLKANFPQINFRATRDRVKKKGKEVRKGSSVASVSGDSSSDRGKKGGGNRVRLDQSDFAAMREFGYDPKTVSPAFLKEWALTKKNTK